MRHIIPATWLNDRDQFIYPNDSWMNDFEFQNDCLTFTLFSNSNNIQTKFGINHWIPFTEIEVDAKEKFASSFMTDFINGRLEAIAADEKLFSEHLPIGVYDNSKREFSAEAKAVSDAGRELWRYYHSQPEVNANASLYDIREYFQGRNDKGRMNARSTDEKYTELIGNLRRALNILAQKITPKIYEYEFLR